MEFAAFLSALGLKPRSVVADGRWRRCPTSDHPRKLNGTYKLDATSKIGWGRNWATMDGAATWKPEGGKLEPVDVTALRDSFQKANQARTAAITAARNYWHRCLPLRGGHPYLEAHGLAMDGCLGLRIDTDGWLVVPSLKARQIQTIQRISPRGDKLFWPGAPVGGSSYMIPRRNPTLTVICEGLATGLACYRALPNSQVIVAWSANNLNQPFTLTGLSVIAADNDHATEGRMGQNPGLDAARKAAEALGIGLAYPTNIMGSDFCDQRQERVADLVARRRKGLPTLTQIARSVDHEISAALTRAARFVPWTGGLANPTARV